MPQRKEIDVGNSLLEFPCPKKEKKEKMKEYRGGDEEKGRR